MATVTRQCPAFVPDGWCELSYIVLCPDPLRGALARHRKLWGRARSCGRGNAPSAGRRPRHPCWGRGWTGYTPLHSAASVPGSSRASAACAPKQAVRETPVRLIAYTIPSSRTAARASFDCLSAPGASAWSPQTPACFSARPIVIPCRGSPMGCTQPFLPLSAPHPPSSPDAVRRSASLQRIARRPGWPGQARP